MQTLLEKRWQDFFWSEFYSEAWELKIDPQRAGQEVDGVLKLLDPSPGSHVLDWCGGWGRHSIPLAKKGFKVTLLDFAPNHIERAKKAAEATGVELNLICTDFRQTPASVEADFAVNLFTSGIGYLEESDDLLALKSLYTALNPGALFLLDTMNLFWLVRNYQARSGDMSKDGSQRLIEQREFDFWTNRNLSRLLYWEKDKKEVKQRLEHRIYSPAELASLLNRAGFKPLRLYGDFDGSPFGFDTKRLILVSEKI